VLVRPLPREATPTLLVVLGELASGRADREPTSTLRQFGLHLAALASTLRAPLTAHLAQLGELTRRTDLPADLRESFELYRHITGETLDRLARAMEWGRRGPLNERVDVAAAVDAAVAALENETFLAGDVRLERDLTAVPPVLGVASQLQLAVEHVVRNACEALAARGGTIRVTLRHEAGRVTLTVRDDGPGIPDSLFPHVFEPFASTKSIATGLGLGLAIVKDIVSRHGGEVSLETGAAGTLVTLGFAALDAAPPAAATPRPRRVLIVDDNAELQETFRLLIQRAGYDVIGAPDAEEALTLVSTHDVDALIIDVQLSGRDGLALLEALALWHPHLLPRVALQTAFAYEERVRAVAERYQVVLLAKPSPVTVLLQTLAELTAASGGGRA
jgi:CheY-like chemotaxis protein